MLLNLVLLGSLSFSASVGLSMTFTGSSYVKYRLMENENKEEMKLTMKFRTYSTHAVVMYARGTDYSILEVCSCKHPPVMYRAALCF